MTPVATEAWQNAVSSDSVRFAVLYSLEHGGGTFAIPSLFPMRPTRGYAVGLGSRYLSIVSTENLGRAILESAQRITGRCCVGTWLNPDTGMWHVEQAVLTSTLADALTLGRAYSQSAVYSFELGKDLYL